MKIAICGSMSFAADMLELGKKLGEMGHEVVMPPNAPQFASGEMSLKDKWETTSEDVVKVYYDRIKEVDAILVVNNEKNHVMNYVGGNALIEMAFAHVLGKTIYLLNDIPDMSYRTEIEAMWPIELKGNLERIGDGAATHVHTHA